MAELSRDELCVAELSRDDLCMAELNRDELCEAELTSFVGLFLPSSAGNELGCTNFGRP